jgi:hypothetical protein
MEVHPMFVAHTKPLFAWDCLEDSPSLGTVKAFSLLFSVAASVTMELPVPFGPEVAFKPDF